MIKLKTPEEIAVMRRGGRIAGEVLNTLVKRAKEGVSTKALDSLAEDMILKAGGQPGFKRVDGYSWATCINLNEGVVHGLPNERRLKTGDVVSIDLGVYLEGFNTDTSTSFVVGNSSPERANFLEVGARTLSDIIDLCHPGNRLGDISALISSRIEGAGYSVVRELTGHGVGRDLHEDPLIPGFGRANSGVELLEGMTLALEVIYALGGGDLALEADGWTFSTRDGKIAGLFEHSVAITKEGPLVLTLP